MTLKEYAEAVASKIDGAKIVEVEKENKVKFVGIHLCGETISPTIYVNDCYEQNADVDTAVDYVNDMLVKCRTPKFLKNLNVTDWYSIKSYLRMTLVNKKSIGEVYLDGKQFGFDDLKLTPKIILPLDDSFGSVTLNRGHIKAWGIDEREALEIALNNTYIEGAVFTDLLSMCQRISGEDFDVLAENIPAVYIVSNAHLFRGAVMAIVAQQKLQRMYPEGYVVIPSSVHEVLVMSKHQYDAGMSDFMRFVNQTKVKPEEVLSDKVYVFD